MGSRTPREGAPVTWIPPHGVHPGVVGLSYNVAGTPPARRRHGSKPASSGSPGLAACRGGQSENNWSPQSYKPSSACFAADEGQALF